MILDTQEALQWSFQERRVQVATLHVAADNVPAFNLYTRFGFVKEALLEDYYCPGRHALKMICNLSGPPS